MESVLPKLQRVCFCLLLQAQNGRQSRSRLSISVRTALCWPMMTDTLWTASKSAAWKDCRRRGLRRSGQPNQTGDNHRLNLLSPENCSTVGQEDWKCLQLQKIYLKMSKEAKPRGWLKAPRQKPAEAAQTLPHRQLGGRRRNRDLALNPSVPTGTRQRRMPQQLRITMLNR